MTGAGPEITVPLLALAWFAAVNAIVSILASAVSYLFGDPPHACAWRARQLLGIRLAPAASSFILAVVLFLPAHAWLEPARGDERIGVIPLTLAALGLLLLLVSALRFADALRATARLPAPDRELRLGGAPVREVEGYRGITLAGIIRPTILIGSRAREVLTPAELDVAVAHEHAHLRAGDNLSRILIHCAPDFLGWFRPARRMERLWAAEAECLADAVAVGGSPVRATRLAAALVKVARLGGGSDLSPAPGWSGFHHPLLIDTRVRRLVAGVPASAAPKPWVGRTTAWGSAVLAAAWLAGVPHRLHWITEALVASLP